MPGTWSILHKYLLLLLLLLFLSLKEFIEDTNGEALPDFPATTAEDWLGALWVPSLVSAIRASLVALISMLIGKLPGKESCQRFFKSFGCFEKSLQQGRLCPSPLHAVQTTGHGWAHAFCPLGPSSHILPPYLPQDVMGRGGRYGEGRPARQICQMLVVKNYLTSLPLSLLICKIESGNANGCKELLKGKSKRHEAQALSKA